MNEIRKMQLAIVLAAAALAFATQMGRADGHKEQELRAIYKELIDAENRHDLPAVRELVWTSPCHPICCEGTRWLAGVLGH
jgi:hypothetical protein